MNEQKEKQVTQPFGPFFNLIFTIAMLISRLLHPVTVQGLEHLPRHGALLMRQPRQQLGPHPAGLRPCPGDYRLRVMAKEELFRNPIIAWVDPGGRRFPGEPGRRGYPGGENRHAVH